MNPLVIDLSHHQTPRDLSFARAAGIRAMFAKCSQGVGAADPSYPLHLWFAQSAGLLQGAYHFGTGKMPGDAQADYFYSRMIVSSPNGQVPPVLALDLEENPDGLPMTIIQAEAFVARLQHLTFGAARPPQIGLYVGNYGRELKIPASSPLVQLWQWLADYKPPATVVPPWPNYTLWQYTDRAGAAPGPDPLDGYDLSEAVDGENTINELWGVAE